MDILSLQKDPWNLSKNEDGLFSILTPWTPHHTTNYTPTAWNWGAGVGAWVRRALKELVGGGCFYKYLKVTGHSKKYCFVGFLQSVQDFFWFITCTFKRPNLRLFRFKISQCVPFCTKTTKNPSKWDKLWNFKSKLLETRAFKDTYYITKKSCTDEGNPTKLNLNFEDIYLKKQCFFFLKSEHHIETSVQIKNKLYSYI